MSMLMVESGGLFSNPELQIGLAVLVAVCSLLVLIKKSGIAPLGEWVTKGELQILEAKVNTLEKQVAEDRMSARADMTEVKSLLKNLQEGQTKMNGQLEYFKGFRQGQGHHDEAVN